MSLRRFLFVITCSLAALLLGSVALAQDAATTTDAGLSPRALELRDSINSRQDEIRRLEAEIASYQVRIEDTGNDKKTLQGAIKQIDLTRGKVASDIKLTQVKITRTNDTISELGDSIDQNQRHIESNKRIIGNIIHRVNQSDSISLVDVILGNASISDILGELNDLERMQASISDGIKSLESIRADLDLQQITFLSQKKQLLSLNAQLADQKLLADQERNKQNQLLKDTKNKESNYLKLLAQSQARKKQFEREVDDYEAQLRVEIDANSFPRPGTKVLAYPMDSPSVTQKFGKTVDSRRLYSSGTHNGMDFRASPGTAIKAAGDGVVVATGDTDRVCRGASYGRWVLIRHKNGLSTIYSHLELVKVTQGQVVEVGDIIGYSGSTGYATGPHLHFGLYVSSAVEVVDLPSKSCAGAIFHIPVAPSNGYLDPQAYL